MLHKYFHILTAMQNWLKLTVICGFCFLLPGTPLKAQQEPMYSQYMFNMLQINPAYAGNRVVDNITTIYRKQWINIPGSPATATLSWDKRLAGTNVGYGYSSIPTRSALKIPPDFRDFTPTGCHSKIRSCHLG